MTVSHDVAIIGCGFSGCLVLAHLVEKLPAGSVIALVDDTASPAMGPAYETPRIEHLLNVRAARMGAYPDQPEHFYHWCQSEDGVKARDALGISAPVDKESFAPRALYGAYLRGIYSLAHEVAKSRGIVINHIRQKVARLEAGNILLTAQGEIISATHVVCASGFAFQAESRHIISMPWNADYDALAGDARTALLVGTGLTAVDTIISLIKAGFAGKILCLSRSGLFPQAHARASTHIATPELPCAPLSLSALVHYMRAHVRNALQWQDALDTFRPITVDLWEMLSAEDRNRIFTRYFTLWNIHRHRMAPEISHTLQSAMLQGRVVHIRGSYEGVDEEGVRIKRAGRAEHLSAAHVFDCRGPSYHALPEYLQPLIRSGAVKPHASGAGVCADERMQITKNVYTMGALLIGQKLETTAVPELRIQAKLVAESIATAAVD